MVVLVFGVVFFIVVGFFFLFFKFCFFGDEELIGGFLWYRVFFIMKKVRIKRVVLNVNLI